MFEVFDDKKREDSLFLSDLIDRVDGVKSVRERGENYEVVSMDLSFITGGVCIIERG